MDRFVEMVRTAQDGKGLENLARVCGLSVQQAQATAEAFVPAFMEAMKDMTRSPENMAAVTQLMMAGPYAALYAAQPSTSTPQQSYPPAQGRPAYGSHGYPPASKTPTYNQGTAQQAPMTQAGMNALNTVFGSSDVSKAVANQVAASTGLSVTVVRQAMPALASLMVGGLAKSLAASGSLQQMAAAMLSRMPVGEGQTRPTPISSGNPWLDAFMAFSAAAGGAAPYVGANPWLQASQGWGGSNPWADAMAHGMRLAGQHQAPPQPPAPSSWQDVVNAMANTMAQTGTAITGSSGQQTPQQPPQAANPSATTPPPAAGPSQEPAAPGPVNPFADYQELFARMLAQSFQQGFQPPFPGQPVPPPVEGRPAPLSPFDFWLEMVKQAQEAGRKMQTPGEQRSGGKHEKSGKKGDK